VLKSLCLGSNVLGFAGINIKAMAEMLEGNTALEELVLIDNSIGDAVARILAKVLRVNRTLRKLDLRRNVIASDGEPHSKRRWHWRGGEGNSDSASNNVIAHLHINKNAKVTTEQPQFIHSNGSE